jgi:hypothetical protein
VPGSRMPGTGGKVLEEEARNWPTATTMDTMDAARREIVGNHNLSLPVAAKDWPTPNCPAPHDSENSCGAGMQKQYSTAHAALEWATPTSRDHKDGADPSANVPTNSLFGRQAPRATGPLSRRGYGPLWPTAISGDAHLGSTKESADRRLAEGKTTLSRLAESMSSGPRRLNPLFVEWLMGWPLGWTDFGPVGTEWSRWLRLMRSELSRLNSH